MNGLLEFGSYGTIIATAICDFQIGNHSYTKDDIVFQLTDVPIQLNYANHSADLKARRNEIYYNDSFLDSIAVTASPFKLGSNYIFDSLFNSEVEVVEIEETIPQDGLILPLHAPVEDSIKIESVNNFEIINNDPCIIRSTEFINNQKINIQYKRTINSLNVELDSSEFDIPYLKLQIKFIGNYDKKSMNSYLIIDKSSMRLTPVMNLTQNGVSNINLYFKVINSNKKPSLAVEKDG